MAEAGRKLGAMMAQAPDGERLAALEARMHMVERALVKIDANLENLNKVAQRGGGAFQAILLLGGVIGWVVGIGASVVAIIAIFRPH